MFVNIFFVMSVGGIFDDHFLAITASHVLGLLGWFLYVEGEMLLAGFGLIFFLVTKCSNSNDLHVFGDVFSDHGS